MKNLRKIEKEMVDAVLNKENWIKTNTAVIISESNDEAEILLHGNKIASFSYESNTLNPNEEVLSDFRTKTTSSRMNALKTVL